MRLFWGIHFVGDSFAQHPDSIDLNFDYVARFHPKRRSAFYADAPRSASDDHIAGDEWIERRAIFHQSWDIEDHLAEFRLLHGLTVEARYDSARRHISELVRCHHPWPERAGMRKVLARRELVRVVLPIANAAVVVARVACDVIKRAVSCNVPPALAN